MHVINNLLGCKVYSIADMVRIASTCAVIPGDPTHYQSGDYRDDVVAAAFKLQNLHLELFMTMGGHHFGEADMLENVQLAINTFKNNDVLGMYMESASANHYHGVKKLSSTAFLHMDSKNPQPLLIKDFEAYMTHTIKTFSLIMFIKSDDRDTVTDPVAKSSHFAITNVIKMDTIVLTSATTPDVSAIPAANALSAVTTFPAIPVPTVRPTVLNVDNMTTASITNNAVLSSVMSVPDFLRPLSGDEYDRVQHMLFTSGDMQEQLGKSATQSLTRKSMYTLQPSELLNDEVINYYYWLLAKRDEALNKSVIPAQKRSHFFNSFFFTKLFDEGDTGRYKYKNVRKWSKEVPGKDIFALDKIFFSCNILRTHWTCIVIFIQEKRIQFFDSMSEEGSMNEDGYHYSDGLLQYLKDEWAGKKIGDFPDADKWSIVGYENGIPQQTNQYDCGVFTCMFADFLSINRPLSFHQSHIEQARHRIALSILDDTCLADADADLVCVTYDDTGGSTGILNDTSSPDNVNTDILPSFQHCESVSQKQPLTLAPSNIAPISNQQIDIPRDTSPKDIIFGTDIIIHRDATGNTVGQIKIPLIKVPPINYLKINSAKHRQELERNMQNHFNERREREWICFLTKQLKIHYRMEWLKVNDPAAWITEMTTLENDKKRGRLWAAVL